MAASAASLPEIPLKRLHPWSRDNRYGTDIIAGPMVAGKGAAFEGMIFKDAQLHVLQRYLELARSHLPETLPPEAQSLQDGYPTLVLTRGVYGRELDPHDGPLRNGAQEAIWETVREARAANPRMRIRCVDVPGALSTAEISRCLEPPLDAYQELAYYDGTWFAPDVQRATGALKCAKEFPRKPLHKPPSSRGSGGAGGKKLFDRKSFGWTKDEAEDSLWTIVWKPVLEPAAAEKQ
eukprot:TRINITY_DN29847_c0_g1_i1.p1 TRINITY_DN29847_c0_g1~~TRINITY_DN29847_c0_g1_i1.p1  ORF type:complete len:253 (+),score=52.06 TRINITY_DN29847_c0_g1_i1:52-759(+)